MAVLTADMKRLVYSQRLGYVATVCPDGTPNLSPRGSTFVWDDEHLAFADVRSPATTANLRRNPAVEINVVDPVERRGYRFKGTGQVLTEGPLFEQIRAVYLPEGQEAPEEAEETINAVVLVKVERALPLEPPAGGPEPRILPARFDGF
jgi:uncharacterized protein